MKIGLDCCFFIYLLTNNRLVKHIINYFEKGVNIIQQTHRCVVLTVKNLLYGWNVLQVLG